MKDQEKLVNICTYSTPVEASMARDILESAGIPCMLTNETFSSIYPIGHTSLGGIQLLSIGVLGKYLEKTYIETKKRPIFIIKESNIDGI